jgi:DNA-binding MarR family transcriptional regulator
MTRVRARKPSAESSRDVSDRLHSAAIHLLRRLRNVDRATGLSGPRASALSVIVFGGPISLGDLAGAEQVRPPTITRLVQGLERHGLVRREQDTNDRRLTRIHATEKGRRVLLEGRDRRIDALNKGVERLDPADLDVLARATDILRRVIQTLD